MEQRAKARSIDAMVAYSMACVSNVFDTPAGGLNKPQSIRLLLEAHAAGSTTAQFYLGGIYCGVIPTPLDVHLQEPRSLPLDMPKGFAMLRDAASKGYSFAYKLLADAVLKIQEDKDGEAFELLVQMSPNEYWASTPALAILLTMRGAELGDVSCRLKLKRSTCDTAMNAAADRVDSDNALREAIESSDIDQLRCAIEAHTAHASKDILAQARAQRDRLKKKARKKKGGEMSAPATHERPASTSEAMSSVAASPATSPC
jgi:hypothetical protein